jgi:glycosyltransferase involved in cell wall biosynthesis
MLSVSVVIPTRDRLGYVQEAVASALQQTLPPREVIVVDDHSTDDTTSVLAARFGAHVRVCNLTTARGRSAARNHGWELACGDLVAFLDSDDLWLPEKLAVQVPFFAHSSIGLVHSGVAKVDVDGHPLWPAKTLAGTSPRQQSAAQLTEPWPLLYTSAVVLRRELLIRTGGFDARFDDWEDWDLFWRIARLAGVVEAPQCLVYHREHSGNTPPDYRQWLEVCRRHLELIAGERAAGARRSQGNLLTGIALGQYLLGEGRAARRQMWRALAVDPTLLVRFRGKAWRAVLAHALCPGFAQLRAATRRPRVDPATSVRR